MAFCGNCGAPITQGNGFCGSCGKQVNSAFEPSPVTAAPSQASSSGNADWAPVSTQQTPPRAPAPRPDTMSWSAVPSANPQNGGWNPVPAQPVTAAPNAGQGWSGAAVPPNAAVAPAMASASGTGLTRNIAGALAYSLGIITGILFLVLEPYRRDRFVRFHAFQSIFYFVFAVAFSIAWSIVISMLMSFSGWVLVVAFPMRIIIRLAMFGLWLYLMYQAYNDREFRIPVLGAIAGKQAQS
jgi:uncharacterized membrane protein